MFGITAGGFNWTADVLPAGNRAMAARCPNCGTVNLAYLTLENEVALVKCADCTEIWYDSS
jgi:predicted Zn finger-like uncharacterized protein